VQRLARSGDAVVIPSLVKGDTCQDDMYEAKRLTGWPLLQDYPGLL
jgi:hypothetical protein